MGMAFMDFKPSSKRWDFCVNPAWTAGSEKVQPPLTRDRRIGWHWPDGWSVSSLLLQPQFGRPRAPSAPPATFLQA